MLTQCNENYESENISNQCLKKIIIPTTIITTVPFSTEITIITTEPITTQIVIITTIPISTIITTEPISTIPANTIKSLTSETSKINVISTKPQKEFENIS